jgi:hypothetical protein
VAARDAGDLIAELRELVAKSIEANSRMIQNGTELVRRASSGDQPDLAKLASDSGEILNRALREYVRLSAVHTSRLIDLGVEVSDRIAGRAGGTVPGGAATMRPLADLRLAGAPGATCQTAFAVDNDNAAPIPVAFDYGMLVGKSGETATDVAMSFEPAETVIPPGGQGRFVLSLTIPDDLPPGVHETLVSIRGLPRLGFRLVLEVGAPWDERAGAADPAPPAPTDRPPAEQGPRPRASRTAPSSSQAPGATGPAKKELGTQTEKKASETRAGKKAGKASKKASKKSSKKKPAKRPARRR